MKKYTVLLWLAIILTVAGLTMYVIDLANQPDEKYFRDKQKAIGY